MEAAGEARGAAAAAGVGATVAFAGWRKTKKTTARRAVAITATSASVAGKKRPPDFFSGSGRYTSIVSLSS